MESKNITITTLSRNVAGREIVDAFLLKCEDRRIDLRLCRYKMREWWAVSDCGRAVSNYPELFHALQAAMVRVQRDDEEDVE